MTRLIKGVNDLATANPILAAQWHPTKNGSLTPSDVTVGSNKKVWWYFPYDVPMDYPVKHLRGKHFDFEWESEIKTRTNGADCPHLVGKAVQKGFNDLETINPELAKEWNYKRNVGLRDGYGRDISTPDKVCTKARQKVWWLLSYDVPDDYPVEHLRGKHFDFEWQDIVSHRIINNRGCPYLSGRAVWKGFNDLETVNPELAKQWHPTRNGNLKPSDVTAGSKKKIWWHLPYDVPMDYPIEHLRGKHFDFEWKSQIHARINGNGCPFLVNIAVWKGFNDLATTHSSLVQEWHPTKNGNLKPTDVTAGSKKKVWWQYKRKNNETGKLETFEWQATITNRANHCSSCPFIMSSKGEKSIRKALESNKIFFKEQNSFPDRKSPISGYVLRDDFAILDTKENVVATIEFNGQQHYEPVDFAGKGKEWAEEQFKLTQERDKIKSDYLKAHGIPQLVISYKEFNKAEEIVENFIKELAKTHDLIQDKDKIASKDIAPWNPNNKSTKTQNKATDFVNNILKSKEKKTKTFKPQDTAKTNMLAKERLDVNI